MNGTKYFAKPRNVLPIALLIESLEGGPGQYQVIVHGSVWLTTKDVLVAGAYAHNIRESGWKHVVVKGPLKRRCHE